VYQLTAEGKERLAELLADVGPDAYDDEGFGADSRSSRKPGPTCGCRSSKAAVGE
jgi:hypothetical protein